MKVLIASAFTQITFGLKKNRLAVFKSINVVPQPYSYLHTDLLFYGDTNYNTKTINLCWPLVEKGFTIPDDAMNLAIHEFGHTILLEKGKFIASSGIVNPFSTNGQHKFIVFVL